MVANPLGKIPRTGPAAGIPDAAFFAVFLACVWLGIDTRLIHHWQGPVFSTMPGFAGEFLAYPGGPAEYLYELIAQSYAWRGWGAAVVTVQVAAVAALTHSYFAALYGRALPLVRFAPAFLLLYHLNLYYDHTPVLLSLVVGLSLAILFAKLSRRWQNEVALLAAYTVMLAAAFYLAGMAMVVFAVAAVSIRIARNPRNLIWACYPLLAVALPAAVERMIYTPSPSRDWFLPPDTRRLIVYWSFYVFYALGTGFALIRRRAPGTPSGQVPRRPGARILRELLAGAALLAALVSFAVFAHRLNGQDRRLTELDYHTFAENWPAALDVAARLAPGEVTTLARFEIHLALHELNRLGDEMFRFPQDGQMLLDLRDDGFLPYMMKLSDMCLRLGRVNEAEHFGSEAMILAGSDPRVCRLMADVHLVKGRMAAARKYLTALSYNPGYGSWARSRLRDLDRDPGCAVDPRIQSLRRRMLQTDDMIEVWQREGQPAADTERLLLNQLEQDPSNRMAFEFLMGTYLLARDLDAVVALMPRIRDMTGPAYVLPTGMRRTPRHYQEAMALYAASTGRLIQIDGCVIEPEIHRRLATFSRIMSEAPTRDAAMRAARTGFEDSFFFYFAFASGEDR